MATILESWLRKTKRKTISLLTSSGKDLKTVKQENIHSHSLTGIILILILGKVLIKDNSVLNMVSFNSDDIYLYLVRGGVGSTHMDDDDDIYIYICDVFDT